jgi:NADPH2:quinone reductase
VPSRNLPREMRAIEIRKPGPPEVLVEVTRPLPVPGPAEILVQVAAAGVNRPDLLQRRGKYPPPPGVTDIPGLEIAGRVAALGPSVSGWEVGDPVCALVAGGGYAEFCLAPVATALRIPGGLRPLQAAALPETAFTVFDNLFLRGRLVAGESLLVHGGSSGIGTLAIQLARAEGARVAVTAGTAAKCEACQRLGAELAVNYRDADFVEAVREWTGGLGVKVILDIIGGDYLARNLECLAVEGRLVLIAVQGGARAELNLATLLMKRLTLAGSTMRSRSLEEKGALALGVVERVWPLVEAGRVRPVIHATFPLAEAARAHQLIEASSHIGKVVLLVE